MSAPLVIGVDVGGTKILSGIVDREGNVLARQRIESPAGSEEEVLSALDAAVAAILDDRVGAIGFGVPSQLERGTGRILRASHLALDDVDLAAHARSRFGLPVAIENDANAAALAEWKLGAGRGASNLILLTVGTGIGGGAVLDGHLYRGWMEIGHMVVQQGGPPCPGFCHGHGHAEALVSGSVADRAAQELWGEDADSVTLVERARAGDADALACLDELADYLGATIASVVNLFDPEVVVVGGGFGGAVADLMLGSAQTAARQQALAPADERLRVIPAELGADAGLIGAGLVGFEALDGAW